MSVHSIDHTDDEISDHAYKGYHIDQTGEVTEFYDHRNDEPSASSQPPSSYRPPVAPSNGYTNSVPTERSVHPMKRRRKDAGCCNCCVVMLTTIGTLPIGTALATLLCLLGTGLFVAGGWNALDQSLELFGELGPVDGNPKTDEAPECRLNPPGTFAGVCVPVDSNDLGNRVPQVFDAIKFSFYGIIPFMLIFVITLACDSQYALKSLKKRHTRNCKTSSTGICMTASLIGCCYIVLLAWIFWLCFTTLGIYYYRIVMLRCYDLNDRKYTSGVLSSICIDLVQLGLIMYQNTNDEGFGKFCGPGTSQSPTYGNLEEYCRRYTPVYNYMLLTFSGCMLIILGMVNFIVILTGNYTSLTHRLLNRGRGTPAPSQAFTPAPSTMATSLPPQSIPASSFTGAPAYVQGTRDRSYPDDDYKAKRSSKDIELDYLIDDESSITVPRRRDLDSNVGLNYYYRDRPRY